MDKIIELPEEVVKAAQDATGIADERQAIEKAVQGFVKSRLKKTPLEAMLELAGSDLIDPKYDYKAMRAVRNADDH